MSLLLWQQVHLRHPDQGRIFKASHELARRLNPEADFLVIDNASPVDPGPYLPAGSLECKLGPHSIEVPQLAPRADLPTQGTQVVKFHESIGHFFHGHTYGLPVRDGPGRAHTLALQMALKAGYDRACYIEADCLFRRPVGAIMDAMTQPVGCQARIKYGYLDWHVWPLTTRAAMQHFITAYDWQHRVGEPGGELPGEHVYEDVFKDMLEVLPITVIRGDTISLTEHNLDLIFPDSLDGLTHVSLACFAMWLRKENHPDLAAILE